MLILVCWSIHRNFRDLKAACDLLKETYPAKAIAGNSLGLIYEVSTSIPEDHMDILGLAPWN